VFEERKITFTTGEAPTKIPHKNIEYMYPIVDQRYMLPKESNTGYVQLEKGQDYLFNTTGFTDELFFITEKGESTKVNFSYDNATNRLTFPIPNLPNETGISYKIITSKLSSEKNDPTTTETYNTINEDLSISNNTLTGTATNDASLTRLEFNFNTSKFDTFKDKIRAMDANDYFNFIDESSNVAQLEISIDPFEPFDINEINGSIYTENKPMILGTGLTTDRYFKEEIYPLLYENYPLDTDIRVNRDETILGTPPLRNIQPGLSYAYYVQNDPENTYLKERFPFRWQLAAAYKRDYVYLQYIITNRVLNQNSIDPITYDKFRYIIEGAFPYVNKEDYEVEFQYILPKQNTGNSIKLDYKNKF